MVNIGITSVGGGVGQAVIRALQYSDFQVRLVGMDTRPMAPGLFWCHAAHLVPYARNEDVYIERLLEICRLERLHLLIPGLDVELGPLARNRERFLTEGCGPLVGNETAVTLCTDKLALSQFCVSKQLPFVDTWKLADAKERASELPYPVILKPRAGAASVGARRVNGREDLLAASEDLESTIVQRYLAPESHGRPLASSGRLDQSNEVSAQFFVDQDGEIKGCFVSVNRLKDGVPIEVTPSHDGSILEQTAPLVRALAEEGVWGPLNLQGRLTSNGLQFFEANARFTGLTGVRAALGYREVDAAIYCAVLGDRARVAGCLQANPGYVATRYVDESIVPVSRLANLSQKRARLSPHAPPLPRRVLITGATGYLVANLIASLLEADDNSEICAGVRTKQSAEQLTTLFRDSGRFTTRLGQLPGSPWNLDGIDTVIHVAGRRPGNAAVTEGEFYAVNTEGTRRLIEAARRAGVKRFLYVSSQSVYGTRRRPPWPESLPPEPETCYAASKLGAESLCLSSCTRPMQMVILRIARIYGSGHVVPWYQMPHVFPYLLANRQPIPVYGDGNSRMDLLHVRDCCAGIHAACFFPMVDGQHQVFNLGSRQTTSILQLAIACQDAARDLGLPTPEIQYGDMQPTEVKLFGMDVRRASSILGWQPVVRLEAAVRELIEQAKQEADGLAAPGLTWLTDQHASGPWRCTALRLNAQRA